MSSLSSLIERFRIEHGHHFHLDDIDPADSGKLTSESKPAAQQLFTEGVERLSVLQDKLSADRHWGLLLIFQAMDAAGKDSIIKHIMAGIDPRFCDIVSFKPPSPEELSHDYMWRALRHAPARGRMAIFNRSYYEEVLVVRANPGMLARQHLPQKLLTKRIWDERFEDIRSIEHYLSRNGVAIRKFFLHVSKKEQKRRFLERLDKPSKNWKFDVSDLDGRAKWDTYMRLYEEMIRETASRSAPWFVVPADKKWFTRLVVTAAVIDALESLDLHYPRVHDRQKAAITRVRRMLATERYDSRPGPNIQQVSRAS